MSSILVPDLTEPLVITAVQVIGLAVGLVPGSVLARTGWRFAPAGRAVGARACGVAFLLVGGEPVAGCTVLLFALVANFVSGVIRGLGRRHPRRDRDADCAARPAV